MNLCNFMVNLGLLTAPEKIGYRYPLNIPTIELFSRNTELYLTIKKYYDVFVLDFVDLKNKHYGKEFYYRYDIFTNFYRRTDKKTGFDKVVFSPYFTTGIRIFLGGYPE